MQFWILQIVNRCFTIAINYSGILAVCLRLSLCYFIHSILKLEERILYSCFRFSYITTVREGREAKYKQMVLDLLVNNQDLSGSRSSWPCQLSSMNKWKDLLFNEFIQMLTRSVLTIQTITEWSQGWHFKINKHDESLWC